MSTSPTVNPLGYQGVHSPNPPAIWFRPRDPDMVTFKDFRNYQIGDEWQNIATRQFFKLVAQPTGQGVWFPITYYINGVMMTLTSDAGIATPAGGTITVAGGNNINTSAAGAVLTINLTAPVTVPNGGTGQTTLLDHGIVVGRGVAAVDSLAVGATGTLLVGATGANPAFGTSADGNFTFTTATAGTDRALTVSNTDNSAAVSAAHLQVTVGGSTSTGDPYINFNVPGGSTYSLGIDNSDSDTWKLTSGATPSASTTLLSITSAGDVSCPVSIDSPTYTSKLINFVQCGTVPVVGDGTYYLLMTNIVIGCHISIAWDGTGRNERYEADIGTAWISNLGCSLTVTSEYHYNGQQSLSNLRFLKETAGPHTNFIYLAIDLANRNGSTGSISVSCYGASNYIIINPGAMTTPIAITSYGMSINTGLTNAASIRTRSGAFTLVSDTGTIISALGTGNVTIGVANTNNISFNNATQGTVGAAGGASALPATPSGFLNININGTPYVIPYYLPV